MPGLYLDHEVDRLGCDDPSVYTAALIDPTEYRPFSIPAPEPLPEGGDWPAELHDRGAIGGIGRLSTTAMDGQQRRGSSDLWGQDVAGYRFAGSCGGIGTRLDRQATRWERSASGVSIRLGTAYAEISQCGFYFRISIEAIS